VAEEEDAVVEMASTKLETTLSTLDPSATVVNPTGMASSLDIGEDTAVAAAAVVEVEAIAAVEELKEVTVAAMILMVGAAAAEADMGHTHPAETPILEAEVGMVDVRHLARVRTILVKEFLQARRCPRPMDPVAAIVTIREDDHRDHREVMATMTVGNHLKVPMGRAEADTTHRRRILGIPTDVVITAVMEATEAMGSNKDMVNSLKGPMVSPREVDLLGAVDSLLLVEDNRRRVVDVDGSLHIVKAHRYPCNVLNTSKI